MTDAAIGGHGQSRLMSVSLLLVDAVFLVILIAMCSLTYLLVERPMQNAGRRLARWLDARFGPDRSPSQAPAAAEPAGFHNGA